MNAFVHSITASYCTIVVVKLCLVEGQKQSERSLGPTFRLLKVFEGIAMSQQPITIQRDIYLGLWEHVTSH